MAIRFVNRVESALLFDLESILFVMVVFQSNTLLVELVFVSVCYFLALEQKNELAV